MNPFHVVALCAIAAVVGYGAHDLQKAATGTMAGGAQASIIEGALKEDVRHPSQLLTPTARETSKDQYVIPVLAGIEPGTLDTMEYGQISVPHACPSPAVALIRPGYPVSQEVGTIVVACGNAGQAFRLRLE